MQEGRIGGFCSASSKRGSDRDNVVKHVEHRVQSNLIMVSNLLEVDAAYVLG